MNHRQRGVAQVEFLVAGLLVFLPLCCLALQLMLLGATARILDVAVVLATRAGTVSQARLQPMQNAVAAALQPLYPASSREAALANALADVVAGNRVELRVLPAVTSSLNQARQRGGQLELPNEPVERDLASEPRARAFLESNLLRVELRYCAPLVVPLASQLLRAARAGRPSGERPSAFEASCAGLGGWPIVAHALQVMQSSREL